MSDGDQQHERIGEAIGRLWRAVVAKLRGSSEYRDVYISKSEELTDEEHLQRVADNYTRRGRRLRRVASVTLLAAFLFIGVGILVFLMPTRFTEVDKLQERIDRAYEDRLGLLTEEAQAQIDYLRALDLYNLYGIFFEVQNRYQSFKETGKFVGNPTFEEPLRFGIDTGQQLLATTPVDKQYKPLVAFQYHQIAGGIISIPAEAFASAAEELSGKAVDLQGINESFKQLKKDTLYSQDPKRIYTAVQAVVSELRPVVDAYQQAEQRKDALYAALSAEERDRLSTVRQLQAVEKRISEALLQANQAQSAWNLSGPWATLLTVRIGTVVLLLYLTTALFATYRYTLTLSAYYIARADALQLLSQRPEKGLINVDELKTLIPLLSPDEYRIDKPPVPYESLVQLGRPGG